MGARESKVSSSAQSMEVTTVPTSPIAGQKPGTSGLRQKTKTFMSEHYLENFVQSTLDALVAEGVPVKGGTLVISGDGRYHNKTAIQIIIKMAAAAGVGRVWCGDHGLLSTPAMSAVIRTRSRGLAGMAPFGGFILSASHNPGGIDEDFGIKYNCENGGPAPEKVTNLIYTNTTTIKEYKLCCGLPEIDLSAPGSYTLGGGAFRVDVFDCVEDHMGLLQQVFDFGAIKALFAREDFSFVYDGMHGVQGPYAKKIFVDEFGAPASSLMNCEPKEDFGGPASASHGHADPNLTHAVELVARMGLNKEGREIETTSEPPVFGAAADGDADRNMIMGSRFFCSPSDSLAVIVANASCIPYFAAGLKGCARSMPTSCALDRVAEQLGIPYFEVPTGWKFFGNLMDSGTDAFPGKPVYTPFICGEESFGTGGDHVREKDGMFAVLAWLQILAAENPDPAKPIVGVGDVTKKHWEKYGRNYYARYDYEGVDKPAAEKMMAAMVEAQPALIGTTVDGMKIAKADMFEYHDPVDGSVSKNQGVRFIFESGSRFVFRLSGTGVAGATIRMYLEEYAAPDADLTKHAFDVVKPIADIALKISKLTEYTGRTEPSVVT
uniref:phosphoglucomutase (alpha-D-glucose-1,6-bisphosphate-dependent) n=1 Tax=Emiliania huxleyi TaxID=2903 RepID=A0A7S3S1R9_EMIHU|mmetsp:Transcript_31417/g.94004  ORF Transcript_31417/g.94004 Transcript_31417/m.94004 type:complete len:606 (+) Transcript_31417:2-1819(+)